jgi:hypothetical protein
MTHEFKVYQVLDEVETTLNVPLEEINDEVGTAIDCVNQLLKNYFKKKLDVVYHRKSKEPSTDETLLFKLRVQLEEEENE